MSIPPSSSPWHSPQRYRKGTRKGHGKGNGKGNDKGARKGNKVVGNWFRNSKNNIPAMVIPHNRPAPRPPKRDETGNPNAKGNSTTGQGNPI